MRIDENQRIMILDAYSYRTLAIVRSWGPREIKFVVGGTNKYNISLHSKYAKFKFIYTSPRLSIKKFLKDINDNISIYDVDYVLPTSEAAILVLDFFRKEVNSNLIIPSKRQIENTFNKWNTLKLAKSIGVTIPKTIYINKSNYKEKLKYIYNLQNSQKPLVFKYTKREYMDLEKDKVIKIPGTTYLSYKSRLEEIEKIIIKKLKIYPELLIQENIVGYGLGIEGIFSKGKEIALFSHKRIREKNPLGGPSAVAESLCLEEVAIPLEYTKKLVMKLSGEGPLMVEYKIDSRTQKPYLMEINGRFWGSILLPMKCGLDFPYLFWKYLTGKNIEEKDKMYCCNIRGRYLLGDIEWLLRVLYGKKPYWIDYWPSKSMALKQFLMEFFLKNSELLLWDKEDIKPFLYRIIGYLFGDKNE